jgi:hypothetical protein
MRTDYADVTFLRRTGLDRAATVLGDLRIDQFSPVSLKSGQRAALVAAHEAGIARDIG